MHAYNTLQTILFEAVPGAQAMDRLDTSSAIVQAAYGGPAWERIGPVTGWSVC